MKKLVYIVGVWLLTAFATATAQEVNEQNPYELVEDVAMKTFDRIKISRIEVLRLIHSFSLVQF